MLNHGTEPLTCSVPPHNALPDPSRELALDPRRAVPPVQQQDAGVIAPMPNGPPDALVHGPHARVFVKVPRGRFARVRVPGDGGGGGAFDVFELGFPLGAVDVGEGEADDDDGAAEGVGEVDAFG